MLHTMEMTENDLTVEEWDSKSHGWPDLLPAMSVGPDLLLLCARSGEEPLGLLALELRPLRGRSGEREALIRVCRVHGKADRQTGCALFEEALSVARTLHCSRLRGALSASFTAADLLRLGGDPMLREIAGPDGRARVQFVLSLDIEQPRRSMGLFYFAV